MPLEPYSPNIIDLAKRLLDPQSRESYVGYFKNDDISLVIPGKPGDFHEAINMLRGRMYSNYAMEIAMLGSARHPRNPDLLADILACGIEIGIYDDETLKILQDANDKLMKLDKSRWNWQVFRVIFDYNILCLNFSGQKQQDEIKERIISLINSLKALQRRHDIEKAYVMEYEYYDSVEPNIGMAKKALEEAINAYPNNCPQCAYLYAVWLFKNTDRYAEVANYIDVSRYTADFDFAFPKKEADQLYYFALKKDAYMKHKIDDFATQEKIRAAYSRAYGDGLREAQPVDQNYVSFSDADKFPKENSNPEIYQNSMQHK